MSPIEGIRLALQQIRAQKLKSFFAVIGVVIGVMFLITVVSVVEGLNRYMEEDFAGAIYGLNTLTVTRIPSVSFESDPEIWRSYRRRPRLELDDAAAIEAALTVPALVGVESSTNGTLVSDRGVTIENVWLTAASADLFRIRNMDIEQGRAFTAPEDRSGANVLVLGAEAAEALYPSLNPVGRTVKVNNIPFRIIGVLEKQGTLFGMSLDNRAMAPARSAMSRMVNPHRVVDNILVRPDDSEQMAAAHAEVEATMRIRHQLRPGQPNDFAIETAEESLSFWDNIKRVLLVAFPMLVSISLVVGGIVIMNIMLVSVTERTREIGLRKALGARQRDIQLQVLVEAATLSGAGAMLGIGIGLVLAQIVSAVSPMPVALAPIWMAVSVALGVGVGVIAGIYPATRAARLDPVVALRQE